MGVSNGRFRRMRKSIDCRCRGAGVAVKNGLLNDLIKRKCKDGTIAFLFVDTLVDFLLFIGKLS